MREVFHWTDCPGSEYSDQRHEAEHRLAARWGPEGCRHFQLLPQATPCAEGGCDRLGYWGSPVFWCSQIRSRLPWHLSGVGYQSYQLTFKMSRWRLNDLKKVLSAKRIFTKKHHNFGGKGPFLLSKMSRAALELACRNTSSPWRVAPNVLRVDISIQVKVSLIREQEMCQVSWSESDKISTHLKTPGVVRGNQLLTSDDLERVKFFFKSDTAPGALTNSQNISATRAYRRVRVVKVFGSIMGADSPYSCPIGWGHHRLRPSTVRRWGRCL